MEIRTIYADLDNPIAHNRSESWFVPNQWETASLCNDISHRLGASLESAQDLHNDYNSFNTANIILQNFSAICMFPFDNMHYPAQETIHFSIMVMCFVIYALAIKLNMLLFPKSSIIWIRFIAGTDVKMFYA